MKNITVIGAGTMGNGIAHVFAQYGYSVRLVDHSQEALDKAMGTIAKNLDRQVTRETLSADRVEGILEKSAHIPSSGKRFVRPAWLWKRPPSRSNQTADIQGTGCRLSGQYPPGYQYFVVIHNPVGSRYQRPEQVVGMHFMNPVPMMPLVEIIRGYNTSEEVIQNYSKDGEKTG